MFTRILALYLLTTSMVFAHTLTISLEELDQAMDEAANGGDTLQQFTLLQLQKELEKLDVAWNDGQITQNLSIADRELDGGCVYTADMRDFDGVVTINEDTSVGLTLSSLNEPFSIKVSLATDFDAKAHIDQNYGIRLLRKCHKYAQDGFNVDMNGTLDLNVEVKVTPSYDLTDTGLLFTPNIAVSSDIEHLKYKLNVTKTILEKPLELLIREVVDDEISNKKLKDYATQLENSLVDGIKKSWGGESLLLDLPDDLSDDELNKLLALVDLPLFSELGEALVRDHLPELFYALLTQDTAVSTSYASSVAICELLQDQTINMSKQSLYKLDGGSCVVDESYSEDGERFTDAACLSSVSYIAENPVDYCEELMDPAKLGNATASQSLQGKWTLSNSTKLNVGVRSLSDKHQPYMNRVNYRSIDLADDAGKCELEMRVFKSDIAATGLKPLLSFHGGSWTFRRSGVIGLEAQVSHFTDQGFVVFEPFYRVTGDDEANPECHNATGEQVLADAGAALDWVLENAHQYGAESNGSVAVTGQSAGAHMAGWLMVHRSENVSRGLLLYPPTDFAHFIEQYQSGSVQTETQGLSAIKRFVGKPVSEIELDAPLVVQNSFPQIIAKQAALYPPAFIVHGSGDTLVPVDQATRLCGAYNGAPDSIISEDKPDQWRQVEKCGDEGELHIIRGAEHALDVCLFDAWCLAGKADARTATSEALDLGVNWLNK